MNLLRANQQLAVFQIKMSFRKKKERKLPLVLFCAECASEWVIFNQCEVNDTKRIICWCWMSCCFFLFLFFPCLSLRTATWRLWCDTWSAFWTRDLLVSDAFTLPGRDIFKICLCGASCVRVHAKGAVAIETMTYYSNENINTYKAVIYSGTTVRAAVIGN